MLRKESLVHSVLVVVSIAAILSVALWPKPVVAQNVRADALVLVNSDSDSYVDFEHYIQPYLDNLGVPYTELDIATTSVTAEIADYAVLIIGHRQFYTNDVYLDATEEGHISSAVDAGTGLVNFNNDLSVGGTPRYQFVQDVFGFSYVSPPTGSGVTFDTLDEVGIRIDCWDDAHQDPVLTTTSSVDELHDVTDGEWTEFEYSSRPYPSVMAGVDEEDYGLPLMHFFAEEIPNDEYEVFAKLYTSGSGRDARYYYGYTPDDPKAHYVDTTGGSGGGEQHTEYSLGTVTITDGTFDIYVQDADLTGSDDYPIFGWAWVRLVPTGAPPPEMHYITERHEPRESIGTGSMTLAGIATPLPEGVDAIAVTGNQPFLAVTTSGEGRAVQWGTYDWMAHSVKGPVYGLDDLVWRSIVWAARKPFVMQGLPPLLPFRIDDCSGPYWWAEDAAAHGLKPWLGFFLHDMSEADADQMKALVDSGDATASIHAFGGGSWFFFDHHNVQDWPDAQIADHFVEGTQWHEDHDIPISTYVLGHYYELGTNAFDGLEDWGVEFIGTHMAPGTGYGAPWLEIGPYREYVSGSSRDGRPVYYADYITVPGHPEHDNKFFNVVTEIRDNAGYEWYPSDDVDLSIERGVIQTKRAFDSMVLATLFTHEQHIRGIERSNWNAILDGVLDGVAGYDPIYVTMDYAAQYVRAMHTSDITSSTYDPILRRVTTNLGGATDIPTQFYLFTECGADIMEQRVDVPVFSESTQVVTQLPGALHRIDVSPAQVMLGFGDEQQFVAQGYDADDVPVVCAEYTWDVVNGGGVIDQDGLFTAGSVPGTFVDTVVASDHEVTGAATVGVAESAVDRFVFETVGDQVVGTPFTLTITALDIWGQPASGYGGPATLTDTTHTMAPVITGPFVDGVWAGEATIGAAATDVVVSVQDGAALGNSNPFTVTDAPPPPPIPSYLVTSESYTQMAGEPFTVTVSSVETTVNLWEDEHQDPVLETFTNSGLFDDTDGEWDEFLWAGHRDYPGVFGGFTEADAGTLETMHFYADVPNGTYRVMANLYYSGQRRHYFGFTPDDPRAHSVDVTYGGADGFAEFDLGTITITDSHFDLYTDYGEQLESGWPYFGWAWVRLEPVVPETKINLWEDDHQDPVLETTGSVGDLIDDDGEWTEFHYSSRPFPSILAGADEEDYGLPLMHFFADVPDGTYELIANLYTSGSGRNMRYFYGFTPEDPKAHHVDVAGGGTDHHREHSLGTVSITDGHFDLYVQDADLLPGTSTYPFFGWAWVRLIANRMTMGSSSATMLFDGDGDGTFGEPGDEIGTLVDGTFDITARDTTAGTGVEITATDAAENWGSATYTVTHAAAVSMAEVSVEPGTVKAGEVVTCGAVAEDAYGNTWDVTGETSFSIESGAGGSWVGNAYTSEAAGEWTVTGEMGDLLGTTPLTVEPAAELSLTKGSSDWVVRVGNELTYTVSVVNGGPGTAADVTITDDLPAGMGLISATSSQGAGCSGMDPVVCDVGDVGSGAMVTVTMVVTPTATGVTYNTAEVAGIDLFENPVSDSGGVLVEVVDPAIGITKEGPATAAVGERVVYTLTVVNDDIAGDGSVIRNPVVNDALAGGATLVSAGDGDDELEVGESWVYTASYTVGPTDPDPLVNTAEVSGEGQDGSGVSATDSHSTDLTFAPALEIEKEGPATAAVGERVEYTFRVRNDDEIGDGSPVSEVAVSDDVAGEAAYASGDDGDSLLEVGETWVYTAAYTIQEGDPDPLVNVGTATGEDREGDEVSATASHSTEVGQPTPEKYQVFLPLVSNGYAAGGAAPDLVVGRISVTGSGVEIVIKNEGEVAVEKGFWVDLYVNPHPVPTGVNQTWQTLSSEGMVWGVEGAVLPLEPGEELALTMGDAHYRSDYSNFSGAFLAGVPVYVQVDSANAGTTYGAVLEGHEMVGGPYNNIAGPAYAVSSLSEESVGEERPVVSDTVPSSSDHPLRTQRTIVRPDQCPPRP